MQGMKFRRLLFNEAATIEIKNISEWGGVVDVLKGLVLDVIQFNQTRAVEPVELLRVRLQLFKIF